MNTNIKASPRPWMAPIEECNQEHEKALKNKMQPRQQKTFTKKTWPKTQRASTKEHDQGDQNINRKYH